MTYDRRRGMEDRYLYEIPGNIKTYRANNVTTLTHSFVDITLKLRTFGVRCPELADQVRLVQVVIDSVNYS
jgi:hypothetical protein